MVNNHPPRTLKSPKSANFNTIIIPRDNNGKKEGVLLGFN